MSAPMITYALLIPGRGFATSFAMNASHLPWMDETSSFVLLTTSSINADLPRVPTMIALVPKDAKEAWFCDAVTFRSEGFTPVTR